GRAGRRGAAVRLVEQLVAQRPPALEQLVAQLAPVTAYPRPRSAALGARFASAAPRAAKPPRPAREDRSMPQPLPPPAPDRAPPAPGAGPDGGPPLSRLRLAASFLHYFRPVRGLVALVVLATALGALSRLPMTFLPKVLTEHLDDRTYLLS